ncbi:coiled-coil domain-containing protein 96 [Anguilla anguilla]|uniref:coiled-coil domain-containing protein 96 n=1 Tax=Anguilla anguilla TaxID=7936 RepID=UPI0015B28B13|nr:coiled-coil domain-containing protein 96 [Anguilla anguilla]
MEAAAVESKQLNSLPDESNSVAEGNSTEAITNENPEETNMADVEPSASADVPSEGSGTVDNTEIAEETGVPLPPSADETGGSQVSLGSTIVPKEETEIENATDEPVEEETAITLADAKPPSSQIIEGEEEQEFKPTTREPMPDTGRTEPEEEEEGRKEESSGGVQPGGSEKESDLADEGAEETENRGQCIDYETYKKELDQLQSERERLVHLNGQLQMKLVEYFRKKTGEDASPKTEEAEADHEQRYLKYMASMEALSWEHKRSSGRHRWQMEELRKEMEEKVDQADSEWRAFTGLKKDAAVAALGQRVGRQAALAEVEQIQASEQRKENELIQVRTENIKLRNAMQRTEAQLAASADLTGSLHLIDFEQLKIENQTYEEKIEERNEELVKLRRKVGRSVQTLTHVTAKLQLLQVENQAQKKQRAEVDVVVNGMRDLLTRTKQVRDGIRADTLQLRQRCGLLGNETLLKDFEEKVGSSETMEERLVALKRRHADLNLKCSKVKKKLEQAKQMTGNPLTLSM